MKLKKQNLILISVSIFCTCLIIITFCINYFGNTSKYEFYSSKNLNNFDTNLITQAKNPEYSSDSEISKITEIDEDAYIAFYKNRTFTIFKKELPYTENKNIRYSAVTNSKDIDCLKIYKLNIPIDFINSISNSKCTEFRFNNKFSIGDSTPKTFSQFINIYPESSIIEYKNNTCISSQPKEGCEYVKLRINYPNLEDVYTIFSKYNSPYYQKFKEANVEQIFDGELKKIKTTYYDKNRNIAAVTFCDKVSLVCIGFESIIPEQYTADSLGDKQYLTFLHDKYKLWTPSEQYYNTRESAVDTDNLNTSISQNFNESLLPVFSSKTIYLGKYNSVTCDNFKKIYTESVNAQYGQLRFRCDYVYYTFAVPKDYSSYEQVVDAFTNGINGFTLHGGAGDEYGSRFGGLSYIKLKNLESPDIYYLNISNSNRDYVIYKVLYDSR